MLAIEDTYTNEDVSRARTYLYTVGTITDRMLHYVGKAAIAGKHTVLCEITEQCRVCLKDCLMMASDGGRHVISVKGQIECTANERLFTTHVKEFFAQARADKVSNIKAIAYLIENIIWFVKDVIRYVPGAYSGTEWRELEKSLSRLQLTLCPDLSTLTYDKDWMLSIHEALSRKIMLLPEGSEPYPCALP